MLGVFRLMTWCSRESANGITQVSVSVKVVSPPPLQTYALAPGGQLDSVKPQHTHNQIKYWPPSLCRVCPSHHFHSLCLNNTLRGVQLARVTTSSPCRSPRGESRDCARLPRPWRFPLSGMEWEYTPQPTMARFQDVPCTIKLCSAQYDGLWGSLFGI